MDERNDKISGSGISGYAACPGKWNAEQPIPKGPAGEAADMGTRIHSQIATGKGAISEDELNIAELCKRYQADLIDQINAGDVTEVILEQRYWYNDAWSGQIDRIDRIGKQVAVVTDYKTGRVGTGAAAENLQLRAYAVLVKKNFPELTKIYVAIIQPMTAGPTLTIAEYDEEALWQSDREINAIVEAAYSPDAKRNPAPDACKYCRAKSVCPEAREQTLALTTVGVPSLPSLSNHALSTLLDRAEVAEDLIVAIKAEAKARLKEGQAIEGYKLSPGRVSRSIENAEDAYGRLQSVIDPAEFAKCCKVSIPQLEKVVATATQTKPKDAKAKLAELLGELLETKTGDSVMSRTK